ncbi:protein phosphatase 1 regulatory subunit 36-like [Culicoides brevitarsis]|uniref:protein phosphatase 1 regulatory subunit 36-like n=1 Tax=Culicoides brevitarsis TaxID=469753 RepID=UPI00307C8897
MSFGGKWIYDEKNDKFEFIQYPKLKENEEEARLRPKTPFIETIEFMLYRKDLILESHGMIKNVKSNETEVKVSEMLSHKRVLLAREFSKIILGEVKVSKYFRNTNKNGLTSYEAFLRFCTLFVFIALHRRALNSIQYEMDRLFRSSHFTKFPNADDMPRYSQREKQVLYGINSPKERCYYFANSPLIQEIIKINRDNKELLWIGDLKYLGPSEYLWQLEKPYITSTTQLFLANTNIGVFGHPKSLYDEHLNADARKIRREKFDEKFDTYGLVRRAKIEIPQKMSLQGNPKSITGMKIRQKQKFT